MDIQAENWKKKIGEQNSATVAAIIEKQKEILERTLLFNLALITNHGGNIIMTERGLLISTAENPTHEQADIISEHMIGLMNLGILKKGSLKIHPNPNGLPGWTWVAFFSQVTDTNIQW